MFEEVFGIPAHPLVVHAAVVFIPLQILAALGYAFIPPVRRFIAWLVVALAVAGPLAALFARLSGTAFEARLIRNGKAGPPLLQKIAEHYSYATNTLYFSIGLGVLMLALVGVQVMRSRNAVVAGDAGGEQSETASAKGPIVVAAVITVAVVAVGAFTGYYIFKTGDTGAHMVWTGY